MNLMISRYITRHILIALLVFFASGTSATYAAPASIWQQNEQLSVRLIAGVNAVGNLATIPLALEVKLTPGWETYWRSPGDAGLPPSFDWSKSQREGNVGEVAIHYPAPHRFTLQGLDTFGYSDQVIFPLDLKPQQIGKPISINARLDILTCKDICVPNNFDLKLDLPAGEANKSEFTALIDQWHAKVPRDDAATGLNVTAARYDAAQDILTIELTSIQPLQSPDVFIENEANVAFAAPAVAISDDMLSASLKMSLAPMASKEKLVDGLPLTITMVDGERARIQNIPLTVANTVASEITPLPAAAPQHQLPLIILFALIGGFILNLMPCVLPVLSLKILAVVSHGGGERAAIRRSFLTTSAGIIASFLFLAAIMITLKATGATVGWGVQFQEPVFIVFLCLLLVLFAANLWGWLEVRLPQWLNDQMAYASYHPRLAGDFVTGAFATLLATPCSAPFLGTAIGFALAAGTSEILAIFLALGIGMALPYLLIAANPGLAALLPKPGRWMIYLRWLLGVALIVTVGWLLFVLMAQIDKNVATAIAVCLAAILLQLIATGFAATQIRRVLKAGGFVLAIAAFMLATLGAHQQQDTNHAQQPVSYWQAFDAAKIPVLVAGGKTVFVDVTADWCLTCIANKRFVLDREAITAKLISADIVAMQADWTNPDPAIGDYLRQHGRYGIPFNVVYGPAAPEGIVLPELLTETIVLDALAKAAGQ